MSTDARIPCPYCAELILSGATVCRYCKSNLLAGAVRPIEAEGTSSGRRVGEEKSIWNGTPSQIINFWIFLICGLLFWLVIPLFIILWRWLMVKNIKYELTTERLKTRYGVFNKTTDKLELYRVRDYVPYEPWYLRIFSLGTLVLETSDKSHPIVILAAINNGEQLLEQIRTHVEACRAAKRVREVDFA